VTLPDFDRDAPRQHNRNSIRNVWGRLRSHIATPLHRDSYILLFNTGLSSGVGFLFWVMAARLYPKEVVGRTGALLAALSLFALIGQLNLSNTLIRFLPQAGRKRLALLGWVYVGAVGIALTLASAVLIVVHLVVGAGILELHGWIALILVLSVIPWSIFILEDAALTGLRRTSWIPIENLLYGISKIGLLVMLAHNQTTRSLFASSVLPLLVICPIVNVLIIRQLMKARRETEPSDSPTELRGLTPRFVLGDAGGGLFQQGWMNLLPILVVALLGASANATFYVSFLLATTIDLVGVNMTAPMMVQGALFPAKRGELARTTLLKLLAISSAVAAAIAICAPFLLRLYGPQYVSGTSTLRLLMSCTIPKAVIAVYLSLSRIEGRPHRGAVVQGLCFIGILGGTLLLAGPLGTNGAALAILLTTGAIASVLLPVMHRTVPGFNAVRSGNAQPD
jgi:O-antigen/teichoic acid export membrane protein